MEPAAAPPEMLPQAPSATLPQAPSEVLPQASTVNGWLTRGALFWANLGKIAVGLIGATLFLAIIVVLFKAVTQRTLVIDAVDVPESLAHAGYTSDVAAKHLRDRLVKYAEHANTRMKTPNLALHGDLPQFVVPTVGLSFESIVAYVRTFLRRENRMNISGEFTFTASSKLKLQLRKNAAVIYTSPPTTASMNPDDFFVDAAPRVFAVTEPYYNAVDISHRDLKAGLEAAQRIIASWPPSNASTIWAHQLIGTILHKKRRISEAIKEYEIAIKADPNFATAYYNKGLALRDQGELDRAIVAFQSAIWIDPDFADAYAGLGSALKAQKRYQESDAQRDRALEKHLAAVRDNPESAGAHENYGTALAEQGKSLDAITELKAAVELNPESVTAHYGLGKVLFDAGLLQEAIKELTTAIMLDEGDFAPGYRNAEAHYTLGMAFMSDKQKEMASHEFQIAIAAYGEAIKRDPGDASAYKDRGNVMLEKSDFEGALQDYSKAIELDPAYLVAYNDRCYVRAIIGKELREAIEDCNVSLKVSPDDAATLDSRGFAYLKLGQFKEAIADYDAALALNSSQAESRYGRGIAKWKNGDVAGGKEDIAAAEKIRGNIAEDMKRYNLCPPSQ